ncbi:MAG: O-antigen ligase family protein [Rhodoferax sp.]|uniref:O-antigen ligase family protein n=1 Tax=Rhodoferax sp. TaxID=50421 RepID=UPI00183BCE57|nr:O-antigen ligase family protein [Rhodoferax sp.]NMM20419.1 O-antigen ligase family protein [Rhodoferax sp.]
MAAIIVATFSSIKFKANDHLVNATLLVLVLSAASIVWGYGYLTFQHIDTIFVDDEIVFYLPIAIKKLFLLIICLSGFHLVTHTRQVDNKTLLRYWFYGLIFAFLVQAMTYVAEFPLLIRRAGVFDEGNFGGSYYLLTFFLMWMANRENLNFGKLGMVASFAGLLLTQSSSALVIVIVLLAIHVLLMPSRSNGRRSWNVGPFILFVVAGLLVALIFGNELTDKLMGEELTTNSFSRYDRLSSILSGLSMFNSSPLFGVGIQGYSFALPNHPNEFLDNFFDYNSQRIANNIYAQLLAEQGLIGISAMAYLLYEIVRPAFLSAANKGLILLGFASILLSWLAFPSYTNTFHWLGFALLFRISRCNSIRTEDVVDSH